MTLSRPRLIAVVYGITTVVFAAVAGQRLLGHSDFNHYVYLADSLLHGQLHLTVPRPPNGNDWAHFEGRWYVSFPPFPAILMLPGVALWGLRFNDRLFTVLLAGVGPALAFLVLERLRDLGRSTRTARENLILTALYAFGTVYFFTAVQGTVWFTAHVVGVALLGAYVLFALEARRPVWAGLAMGLGFLTRPPLLFAFPLFLYELWVTTPRPFDAQARRRAAVRLVAFGLPVVALVLVNMWWNWARFHSPFVSGHEYLTVAWGSRIRRWGLFNYHFLARNLTVATCLLPWLTRDLPYVQISNHGLALWLTTPLWLYLLSPQKKGPFHWALVGTLAAVAVPSLFYQNDGWIQFGYRFSNDYNLLLLMLLAIGARPMTRVFRALVVVAVAVNLFGAITFDRMPWFYDSDMSATNIFQPD